MSRWISPEQATFLEVTHTTLIHEVLTREDFKNLVQTMLLTYADVLDAIVQEEETERNHKISRKMNKTCRQNLKRDTTSPKG